MQQWITKSKLLTGAAMAALVGCSSLGIGNSAPKQAMEADPSVPAAKGTVSAKQGDNGNTELRVNVEHLAKPEVLEGEAKNYVVWVQDSANGERVQNVGALMVNEKLEGELRALTPMRQFQVFITPEPVANAESPSGDRVLWTTVTQ